MDLSPPWETTNAPILFAIAFVESVLKQSTTMISICLYYCEVIDLKHSTIVPSEFLEGIITDTRRALSELETCESLPRAEPSGPRFTWSIKIHREISLRRQSRSRSIVEDKVRR